MVTIKDIAIEAGVAKSTVSNVLTGKKYVSPEIKRKVLEICKKNDYEPNFFASTLSSKTRTNIIGLFLEKSAIMKYRIFYSSLIEGMLVELSKYNSNLLIYSGLNSNETTKKLKEGNSPIDGAIILSPTVDDDRISEFNRNLIPYVLIGHPSVSSDINFVDTDNVLLTYNITNQMISKGYKKICLINSNKTLVISKERNEGLIKAYEENDLDGYYIYHSENSTKEDGYRVFSELIKEGYDACITASGVIARGVYDACNEAGLKIGEDVAIFSLGYSFDQDLTFEPSLSYAAQDYFKFGTLSVSILNSIINGKNDLVKQTVQSEIHYNSSFKL